MNYEQLTQAILTYTENWEQEAINNIPNFVRQAEQRIYQTVQPPVLRKNMKANMASGNPYLDAPPGFLAVYSLPAPTEHHDQVWKTKSYTERPILLPILLGFAFCPYKLYADSPAC